MVRNDQELTQFEENTKMTMYSAKYFLNTTKCLIYAKVCLFDTGIVYHDPSLCRVPAILIRNEMVIKIVYTLR